MTKVDGVDCNATAAAATLRIDRRIYSKSAVLRTCYWLAKDLSVQVDEGSNSWILKATLRVTTPTLENPRTKTIDECLADFFDTLLDSQLRVEIQAETSAVRELIIAKAFAESGVLEDDPPGTFSDPVKPEAKPSLTQIKSVAGHPCFGLV